MPAQFVKAFRKSKKNEYIDAEAITETVQRPTMRFVPIETGDQLDLQALHRVELTSALRIVTYHFREPSTAHRLVNGCRNGWNCQSLGADLKTSLHWKLRFASSNRVVELVERPGDSLTRRAG
jgi:hypothetical protein